MFDNSGNKIKAVTKIFCLLGITCSIVFGLILIITGSNIPNGDVTIVIGIAIMIVGSFMSWVSSLVTYGIGEMIQNSCVQTEIAMRSFQMEETKSASTQRMNSSTIKPRTDEEYDNSSEESTNFENVIQKLLEK